MAKPTTGKPAVLPVNHVKTQLEPPAQKEIVDQEPVAPIPSQFPPTAEDVVRLANYQYFEQLSKGNHFEAFNIKIRDIRFNQAYEKLRYIKANFPGLISKIMADMLFSEPVKIKVKNNQEFVDAFVRVNQLNMILYESELTNSSLGDAVFKLRLAPLNPEDPADQSTVIVEEISPKVYFPVVDPFNVKGKPVKQIFAWKFKIGDKEYVRQEIHTFGKIENKLYAMKGDEIIGEEDLNILGLDLKPVQTTNVKGTLVFHVPNFRNGNVHFGESDYTDVDGLFFAINNRITMIDNILDKHSDPILMVPPGVIDKKGNVNKKALGVIEYEEGSTGEPKYIVWDASLENAFKYLDKIIEIMFMITETSPDILGMGQGQAESGRALKLKLLRTIAKAQRKRIYYDAKLKDLVYKAQEFAVNNNATCDGVKSQKPEVPTLEWRDGLPNDDIEQAEIEQIRIDSGTTSKKDSIMRLDSVDEKTAEEKLKEINEETKIALPLMNPNTNFNPGEPGKMDDEKPNGEKKPMMKSVQ